MNIKNSQIFFKKPSQAFLDQEAKRSCIITLIGYIPIIHAKQKAVRFPGRRAQLCISDLVGYPCRTKLNLGKIRRSTAASSFSKLISCNEANVAKLPHKPTNLSLYSSHDGQLHRESFKTQFYVGKVILR